MLEKTVKNILNARVYEAAIETPLERAEFLSHRLKNRVFIKREDLQPVFSFKLRGAYNKMTSLAQEEREQGVICASAGNHAQGVAEAARLMGIRSTIVMPTTTPEIKVDSVRSRGGLVVLHGDTFDEALAHARQLQVEGHLTFIHPYDDMHVIAGQGTVAREILHQHNGEDIHAVFVPVGGGGLISGMAAYLKYLQPNILVIGVEFEESACLFAALQAGMRVVLDQVGIFADGIAVAQVGAEPWKICKDHVDEVITVSSDEICAAVKDIFDDTRSITEPAGAVSIAGMKKYIEREGCQDKTFVTVSSGANTNFDRLRYVAERAEVGERREAILSVRIPERAGAFLEFVSHIGQRSISEFNYRYAGSDRADIFVGVKVPSPGERQLLVATLKGAGYAVLDLTEDEVAKSHVRYMVGGHAPQIESERLFRFEFPERPGALGKFLTTLGGQWNISLFHYRNHGAAYGRVLVGIQVPDEEEREFREKLKLLGYPYWEESDNPAYMTFLG